MGAVLALTLVVGLAPTSATASPPAPPPLPPPADAPADTYRGRMEAWVRTRAYPVLLERTGAGADGRFWADRSVRSTPGATATYLAATPDARAIQVVIAYRQVLERDPSGPDRAFWAGRLTSGWSHDRLMAFLLSSPEQQRRFPADADWVTFAFDRILGRTAGASDRSWWVAQIRASDRNWTARRILGAGEARGLVADAAHRLVLGRAPTTAERSLAITRLGSTAGDLMRLRAELVIRFAPAGYRVGVVGDSVGFDLVFRTQGQALPGTVTGIGTERPVGSGRLGCAVLSDRPGYRWPRDPQLVTHPPAAAWGEPADGKCDEQTPLLEDALFAHRPQVLVWQVGSWEWTPVMRPDGTQIAARSAEMRTEVVDAMVRRIDGWAARGVRKVLLPEWACVGDRSAPIFQAPGYTRFVRSILAEVVRQRPAVASIAATPPQVCIGGDPTAEPTQDHRVARGDQFHWATGPNGAAWGWRMWMAPAIADLRAVV